ncbi:MAG TPA: phosphonate ABC transporter substrate-binding protein [Xanthobacteraceae bacterium]|nr:phosphonate ABC transporter substrate-binding protein [Xanthobacteraceae bacterium]
MLRKLFLIKAALLSLIASASTAAQTPVEINFGVISTEASVNQKKNWEPFLQAIAKSTGFKINGFYSTDYAGVIEVMRFNKVQVAWFGNKSGMEAADRAGGEVFAQIVSRNGNIGYYSHVIVHRDSPFATLDDILKCDKSLDFGIGDPNSTSGFLVPTSYIFAARNIDPKSCFKTVRNANHQANAMAVANRQVSAATNNSEDLQRIATTAPDAREKIKIIWTSPLIPLDPLMWRKDLDPAVKGKLYTSLMNYGHVGTDAEIKTAREILANLVWSPFHPSSDDQLLSTRKLEANRDLLKVKGDAKLSDDQKAKEIAVIQAQLAKLDELEKRAEANPFRSRIAAFIEAETAGRQDDMSRTIAEFAAMYARTN